VVWWGVVGVVGGGGSGCEVGGWVRWGVGG
jgi:hypothetical protein